MCASPRGAATAILAVPPLRIDAPAHLTGGYLRQFCCRRNFVRQCWRVILAESSRKTELSGVLKGVDFGAHAGRPVLIYANWSMTLCSLPCTFEPELVWRGDFDK